MGEMAQNPAYFFKHTVELMTRELNKRADGVNYVVEFRKCENQNGKPEPVLYVYAENVPDAKPAIIYVMDRVQAYLVIEDEVEAAAHISVIVFDAIRVLEKEFIPLAQKGLKENQHHPIQQD